LLWKPSDESPAFGFGLVALGLKGKSDAVDCRTWRRRIPKDRAVWERTGDIAHLEAQRIISLFVRHVKRFSLFVRVNIALSRWPKNSVYARRGIDTINPMKTHSVSLLCASSLLFLAGGLSALAQTKPAAKPVSAQSVYAALAGRWTGTLEYRDYGNDKRVKLPTLLDAQQDEARSAMELDYTYDDGPGKTVKDKDIVRITPSGSEYIVREKDGSETKYRIGESSGFGEVAGGRLVLFGPGTENKKPVEVRTTLEVDQKSLVILRETRLPGEKFKFRHQYSFVRASQSHLLP
jgi:hypothetical protein